MYRLNATCFARNTWLSEERINANQYIPLTPWVNTCRQISFFYLLHFYRLPPFLISPFVFNFFFQGCLHSLLFYSSFSCTFSYFSCLLLLLIILFILISFSWIFSFFPLLAFNFKFLSFFSFTSFSPHSSCLLSLHIHFLLYSFLSSFVILVHIFCLLHIFHFLPLSILMHGVVHSRSEKSMNTNAHQHRGLQESIRGQTSLLRRKCQQSFSVIHTTVRNP